MSELPQNTFEDMSEDVTAAPQLPHFSVGGALRDARIQSGMSVNEVSSRIKFAPRQIEALEADDYAQLPEIAFVRGFVRGYARLLELDADALLAALPQGAVRPAPEHANALAEVPFPNAHSTRKPNIMWLGAGLGVAVVLGLFVWLQGGSSDGSEQQPQVMSLVLPDAAPLTVENEAPTPMGAAVEPATMVAIVAQPNPPAATAIKPAPVAAVESAPLNEVKPVPAKPVAEVAKPVVPVVTAAKPAASGPLAVAVKPAAPALVSSLPIPEKAVATPATPVQSAVPKPVESKPVVSQSATTANAQGAALIHFAFDAESWVEVKEKGGRVLMAQLNAQGSERQVRGEPPFTLLVGNSGGVRLTYKGKIIDLTPHSSAQVAHLTLE